MLCPSCNTQNLAASVRCMQCSTILIHETEGHSPDYRKGVRMLDCRIYSGIGAFLGFGLAAILLNSVPTGFFVNERFTYATSIFSTSICGWLIAWFKGR